MLALPFGSSDGGDRTPFLLRLETRDGVPAEPPTLSSAVPNWGTGDTIPLGHRTLRVVSVRDQDADEPPVLVVEDVAGEGLPHSRPRAPADQLSICEARPATSATRIRIASSFEKPATSRAFFLAARCSASRRRATSEDSGVASDPLVPLSEEGRNFETSRTTALATEFPTTSRAAESTTPWISAGTRSFSPRPSRRLTPTVSSCFTRFSIGAAAAGLWATCFGVAALRLLLAGIVDPRSRVHCPPQFGASYIQRGGLVSERGGVVSADERRVAALVHFASDSSSLGAETAATVRCLAGGMPE